MTEEAVAVADLREQGREAAIVARIEKDELAVVAAGRQVVDGAGELETQRTADPASVGRALAGRNRLFSAVHEQAAAAGDVCACKT